MDSLITLLILDKYTRHFLKYKLMYDGNREFWLVKKKRNLFCCYQWETSFEWTSLMDSLILRLLILDKYTRLFILHGSVLFSHWSKKKEKLSCNQLETSFEPISLMNSLRAIFFKRTWTRNVFHLFEPIIHSNLHTLLRVIAEFPAVSIIL